MNLNKIALVSGLIVSGIAVSSVFSSANAAIVWDWSVNNPSFPIFGTFTTTGTTPQPNTPYAITSITGQDGVYGIDYLYTNGSNGVDNTFEWDGTANSQLLLDSN